MFVLQPSIKLSVTLLAFHLHGAKTIIEGYVTRLDRSCLRRTKAEHYQDGKEYLFRLSVYLPGKGLAEDSHNLAGQSLYLLFLGRTDTLKEMQDRWAQWYGQARETVESMEQGKISEDSFLRNISVPPVEDHSPKLSEFKAELRRLEDIE